MPKAYFYPGQKLVCQSTTTGDLLKVGKEYTVADVRVYGDATYGLNLQEIAVVFYHDSNKFRPQPAKGD